MDVEYKHKGPPHDLALKVMNKVTLTSRYGRDAPA